MGEFCRPFNGHHQYFCHKIPSAAFAYTLSSSNNRGSKTPLPEICGPCCLSWLSETSPIPSHLSSNPALKRQVSLPDGHQQLQKGQHVPWLVLNPGCAAYPACLYVHPGFRLAKEEQVMLSPVFSLSCCMTFPSVFPPVFSDWFSWNLSEQSISETPVSQWVKQIMGEGRQIIKIARFIFPRYQHEKSYVKKNPTNLMLMLLFLFYLLDSDKP